MSFWSKLGKGLKIAAPFAAMAIPGVGPIASMAIGAGMGVGGGLLSGDSFGQDMLNGALGAAGGASKFADGGAGGVLKKVAGKVTGAPGGGGGNGGNGQGFGWQDLIGLGGKAVDAYGKSAAENRGAQLAATMDQNQQNITAEDAFQKQLLARAQEDRAAQNNAWKQLQQASYVANRGNPAATGFSPYTRALTPISEDVVNGARSLVDQNRDSLMAGRYNTNGGAPLPMPTRINTTIDPALMKGSTGERVANVAGPALDMWSIIANRGRAPVMNTQPVRS